MASHWHDDWDEDDEWYARGVRHVSGGVAAPPLPARRVRDDLLNPLNHVHYSHHRSRSQGSSPQPNVTIYNTTRMDNDQNPNIRTEQKSPALSPRGRSRRVPGGWDLDDEIEERVRKEVRKNRSRSRSSPHIHHHVDDVHASELERYKLEQANIRLREAEERLENERREELIKRRMELKYLKDRHERDEEEARIKLEEERMKREWELRLSHEERKRLDRERAQSAEEERMKREWELKLSHEERKRLDRERAQSAERKRIIAEENAKRDREERERERRAKEAEEERKRIILENAAKMEKAEREAKEARQRAVDEFNKEQAEKERKAKAERERVVAEYEAKKIADATKAKEERERLIMQLKIEEEQRKQKEKEEWERFLLKQKQKEQEEKEMKEKKEKELEEEMRHRLAHFGFQENQIQAMIRPEEARKLQQGQSPANPLRLAHQPTYVKVHKEHLAIDTLVYYDIPYEIDRTNPDYIVILQEMEPKDTEVLFEHTRRLRTRTGTRLLIEERHDHHNKPEYAWVRRRKPSRSPSRRRSSPKRVVGIKEMFY
ncbi:hypothetical protein DM02DRAFT_649030 [Periconia macrospinosa]|uniref:Uncharacterized protein n=1 Tax=Periconia macrospinosa TaxID=97972 RepID=A0A2V1E9Q6_9PLEO|nr:hypothetical protein DM02DRAFT_649030 [Periconia macrospinosa]